MSFAFEHTKRLAAMSRHMRQEAARYPAGPVRRYYQKLARDIEVRIRNYADRIIAEAAAKQ